MSLRQSLSKIAYPIIMRLTGKGANARVLVNNKKVTSLEPFYSLHAAKNNGKDFSFVSLRGKKVLLVNTASDCGFTPQYDELEKLYEENSDKLVIMGFPANDFKEQEKRSDEEIATFCKINFGVTFPLMKKSSVIKGGVQNDVFKWLTDKKKNGWNDQPPIWNFCKYLVDENGTLKAYFGPSVSPLSAEILNLIKVKKPA